MIRTNLRNKNRFHNNRQRHEIAIAALEEALTPKPQITIIRAIHYPTFVDVFHLVNITQKTVRISTEKLGEFIQECYDLLPQSDMIDMNLSDYIEENLNLICASYLEAGKEVIK